MYQSPNIMIVTGRCKRTKKMFGIRFEEKTRGQWIADWAFPIDEAVAKKEGYDRNQYTGSFDFEKTYPGCPYCHAMSITLCNCGKVSCWDHKNILVTCSWCGVPGLYTAKINRIHAGGDR